MEKHHHRTELHLLPIPAPPPPPPGPSTSRGRLPPKPPRAASYHHHQASFDHVPSSLDLQLSISLTPFKPQPQPREPPLRRRRVEALKWQAAEQIRLAAMERAYAESVRELTRREMEMAQSEMARARILWKRTMEDVARAEEMKENAIIYNRPPFPHQVEITCSSCRRRFHPAY